MVKFILAKITNGKPMLFFNAALGEWMLTPAEATKMHKLVANDYFDAMRHQKGVKILPIMVDRR